MVSLKVKCPHCGKSLMNTEHKLDRVASIELKITYAGKNAPIYLSSKYGSYAIESNLIPPQGKVAGAFLQHGSFRRHPSGKEKPQERAGREVLRNADAGRGAEARGR